MTARCTLYVQVIWLWVGHKPSQGHSVLTVQLKELAHSANPSVRKHPVCLLCDVLPFAGDTAHYLG